MKQGNVFPTDPVEGRESQTLEPLEGKMTGTLGSIDISTKQKRIADLARKSPEMMMTNLAHHVDKAWMLAAYRRTRKDGAVGVDGQSAEEYEQNLDENLEALLERFKSGRYRAPPVRRVHIPKGDGRTRPIGIPSFEDKILQRAVCMLLEPVYEQDFFSCSYGYRPRRSAHLALKALRDGLKRLHGGTVIELDIVSLFDELSHVHLRHFLDRRIRDGVVRRVLGKWLKAGVVDGQTRICSGKGTPQGGVISPLLANVYLHEVLDRWFHEIVVPRMRRRCFMIRFADDAALIFESPSDAERVMKVLAARFAKYDLTLHPEKTKLIDFYRPRNGKRRPDTFNLLGFTLYWGRARAGFWNVQVKTAKKRLAVAIKRTTQWCAQNRHKPIADQHQMLVQQLRGHYAYFGVSSNYRSLVTFYWRTTSEWRKWLSRRSRRAQMSWPRFLNLLRRYPLPRPRIVHNLYT